MMNKFNQREQNYINTLLLETIIQKKKSVIEELEQINTQKKGKKETTQRETHLKEERRLLNGIFQKIMK